MPNGRGQKLVSLFGALLLELSMGACGGNATSDSGPDGSGGGSDGSDGSSDDGTGGASGGTNTGGNGTGGGFGSECPSFADESGGEVTVIIENRRAEAVFLGPTEPTCGGAPLFELHDGGSRVEYFDTYCSSSCGDVMENGFPGCPAICLLPDVVELGPGETHTLIYDGRYHRQRELPGACHDVDFPADQDLSCFQRTALPAGSYKFLARAGTELDCREFDSSGECGPCEVSPMGGCIHQGPTVAGDPLVAETVVELGPEHGISGASGDGTVPIEIVFSE